MQALGEGGGQGLSSQRAHVGTNIPKNEVIFFFHFLFACVFPEFNLKSLREGGGVVCKSGACSKF